MDEKIQYVQLEPGAFLTDLDFQMMDAEERGVYCSIIFYLYCNNGKIEIKDNSDITLLGDEHSQLAVISGYRKSGKDWKILWGKISHKFLLNSNILTHKRVLKEIEQVKNFRKAKSNAGKKGMAVRWDSDNTDITKESKVKESKVNNTPLYPPINFNFESGQFEGITNDKKTQWAVAFPAVDIELEIKKAALWVIDNPQKRKSNWGRFLTNWFSRTQERGGSKNWSQNGKNGFSKSFAPNGIR